MLKRMTVIVVAMSLAVGAMAMGGARQEQHLQRLSTQLGLDVTQQEQFTTIMQDMHQQRKAMMQQMRTQMDTLRDQTDEKLAAVLTPEQLAQLKTFRQQMRDEMRHGKHHAGKGFGPMDDESVDN